MVSPSACRSTSPSLLRFLKLFYLILLCAGFGTETSRTSRSTRNLEEEKKIAVLHNIVGFGCGTGRALRGTADDGLRGRKMLKTAHTHAHTVNKSNFRTTGKNNLTIAMGIASTSFFGWRFSFHVPE